MSRSLLLQALLTPGALHTVSPASQTRATTHAPRRAQEVRTRGERGQRLREREERRWECEKNNKRQGSRVGALAEMVNNTAAGTDNGTDERGLPAARTTSQEQRATLG